MAGRSPRALAATVLMLAVGCAHAPPPRPPLPAVEWPAPPAAPRMRLVGLLPDPAAPPPPRSFWRRVADAIVGADPARAREPVVVRPFGVAATADGGIVVADPDLPGVLRFDRSGTVARVECRSRGWGAPIAVALAAGGALAVADAGTGEVVIVAAASGSCRTLGRGELERPTGVAVAGEGFLVVDPPRHAVVSLSAAGQVVARFGSHGEGEGQFNFPTAIAPAPDGSFLVVDALNFRIVRMSADGRWLGAFGTPGETGAAFARPKGVAADEQGRVYVTDAQRDLVLVFRQDGAFDYAAGASGTEPGRFALPSGVAVGAGRLYVADSQNRRVQVFEIVGGSS